MFRSVRNELLLGSLAAAMFAKVGAASAPDSGGQTFVSAGTMSQPGRITMRGTGARQPILKSTSDQGENPTPVVPDKAPHPIREGQLLNIPPGSPLRSEVTIAAVAAKEIQHTLTFTGVVEADPSRTVQVLAPITGRVVDVKVQLGDRVAPDQELAIIHAGVAQAYSDDRRVQSTPTLSNKPITSGHQTGLQRNPSDAASDCQHGETERLRSTTRLCALIMPDERTGETRLLSLRAPAAGSVIDLGIHPGVMLDDPSSSIMTIADLDTIWVATSVHKKDTALIAPGRPVEIAFIAYPNEVFTGEARFIGDVLDPYASSFKVRIELPNPTRRLKPNMSALVTLLGTRETLPIIPPTALIHRNERDWVFVEVGQWTFAARPVKVGFPQDDQTVIASGLNIGERIVVMGGALLQD